MAEQRTSLNEIKAWPLELIREQYLAEQADHRAAMNRANYRTAYHEPLSAHYRLGYMRWLLAGSPQPQPRFV